MDDAGRLLAALDAAGLQPGEDWKLAERHGATELIIREAGLAKLSEAIKAGVIPGRLDAPRLWRRVRLADETFGDWSGLT